LLIVLPVFVIGCDQLVPPGSGLDETGWFSHDKMAVVVSRAWTVGEYKVCQSYDSGKENAEPILSCDSDGKEAAKRFKVAFYGPTYINWQPPKTTFNWDCKKSDADDLVFSCWRKGGMKQRHRLMGIFRRNLFM
jgi:hypothetical protein